jgi:hypothetical protein
MIITLLYFIGFYTNNEDYQILNSTDVSLVVGGSSSGSGKGSSSGNNTVTRENITLKNVPYVYQYTASARDNTRSIYYCQIASSLMVRAKYEKTSTIAPSLYYEYQGGNYASVDTAMSNIDDRLIAGGYGHMVDLYPNQGVLYIANGETQRSQYNKTVEVIKALYTSKKSDGMPFDNGNVNSIDVKIIGKNSGVTDQIWSHIKDYRQPVVALIDSNIRSYVDQNGTEPSYTNRLNTPVSLHCIVIRGITDDNSSGTKYFKVYDPAYPFLNQTYTETQLKILMSLPSHSPV